MKKLIYISIIFWSFNLCVAQELEIEEDHVSEFIYGLNINSNGGTIGGIHFKSSKIIKPKQYRTIGLEIVGIKNPKEIRILSEINSFIPYKTNYFFSIRPQYGRDIILFKKAQEEGIQISAIFAAGPSIGLQVPYHILYSEQGGFGGVEVKSVQYDPKVHVDFNRIEGVANFFDGFANTQLLFGGNAKVGLSLDFSPFGNSVTGVEAGFTFEIFGKTPKIMESLEPIPQENLFTAVYLTLFFGSRR